MTSNPIITVDLTAIPNNAVGVGRYVQGFLGPIQSGVVASQGLVLRGLSRHDDARRLVDDTAQVAPAGSRIKRLVWEQTGLVKYLRDANVSVHHGVHYTLPYAAPKLASTRMVATIHDCTFFDHPEWHERSKAIMFRRAIAHASAHADALICVSQFTADRLIAHTNTQVDIHVVPHGVDSERFASDEALSAAQREDDVARRRDLLGNDAPYVLYVGTLEPRKGVASLIRAFDKIAGHHADLKLVLAGKRGWGLEAIDRALGQAKHRDRIMQLGFVADDDVPLLYRGAALVTYPSEEEGFGLPALEAISCGAMLITTTGSAIQEAVGDDAILVEPTDEPQLADAIDAALRAGVDVTRRERGIARAKRATWDVSATAHVAVYRSLV